MVTQEQLEEVADNHKLYHRSLGEQGIKAIFVNEDLRGLNFKNLFFAEANFEGCSFEGVFENSNFHAAWMKGCNFGASKLSNCHFGYTLLYDADMSKVQVSDCLFAQTLKRKQTFNEYEGLKFPRRSPETGELFGYTQHYSSTIVEWLVPQDALRADCWGTCYVKANKATLVRVVKGDLTLKKFTPSKANMNLVTVGSQLNPHKDYINFNERCSKGLEFFLTLEEAEQWIDPCPVILDEHSANHYK